MFSVMVFPVCKFVNEAPKAPAKRKVMDPSAVLRILVYSLLTPGVTRTSNPQNDADRVKGVAGPNCHPSPRARAGEAVTTPPSTHSSAPSVTITLSRLIAFFFLAWLLRGSRTISRRGRVRGGRAAGGRPGPAAAS